MKMWKTLKQLLNPSYNNGWTEVFSSSFDHEITLVRLHLENEGIPVRQIDKRDSSYNNFGFVYLSVPNERKEEALTCIQNNNE